MNGLGVLDRVGGCLWQGFGGKGVSIGEAWCGRSHGVAVGYNL